MATIGSLPAIDDCIDVYLTAHTAFGDDPFSTTDLAEHVNDGNSSVSDVESRLPLLVAYGLVDRTDDDRYQLRCLPNESITRWRERAAERAEMVHWLITDRRSERRTADELEAELLKQDGEPFVSVFVFEDDDVESVAATAASALARNESVVGIALRGSGARADRVQRIADRLCSADIVDRTRLESSFEKGVSDVVGESKDTLEFRLFLRTA